MSLRAVLDQQKLPGPLRMLAFWDDDFTLESDVVPVEPADWAVPVNAAGSRRHYGAM